MSTEPASGSATGGQPLQGHALLAQLGKRVLRPGGLGLSRTLLENAGLPGADVVELAPGRGRTAAEIVAASPRSYVGIDRDSEAVSMVQAVVRGHGEVHLGDAANTGLPDASADVVIGEAMLTMQGDKAKDAIVAEATRLLRPGGRYAIHEMGLTPDTISEQVKTDVRQSLARAVRVNARPLTIPEWQELLADHGLIVEEVATAPMALLQPRRLVADEGITGALRFGGNLLRRPTARRRVLTMRRTFRANRRHLLAVAIVARKPAEPPADTDSASSSPSPT